MQTPYILQPLNSCCFSVLLNNKTAYNDGDIKLILREKKPGDLHPEQKNPRKINQNSRMFSSLTSYWEKKFISNSTYQQSTAMHNVWS